MAQVDPVFAQWLQSDALWAVATDATLLGRWGDKALTTERSTTIALRADAIAEGQRQLTFLGGPLAIEEHLLAGTWADRLGQVVTLAGLDLGYDAGLQVFIIGVRDERATGLSTVTVIRRL